MATSTPAIPPAPAIPERVRLVIALTEINSRHLRSETRRAGAEIELESALEDARRTGVSLPLSAGIVGLQARLAIANSEAQAIEAERTWLEQALVHFDDIAPDNNAQPLQ